MLDVVGIELSPDLQTGWQRRIAQVGRRLGWPLASYAFTAGNGAATLGFTAPADQLQTAREANEWALCAALLERDPAHWSSLHDALRATPISARGTDLDRPCATAEIEERAALARLERLSVAEARAAHRG